MFTGLVAAFSFFNCQRWEYTTFPPDMEVPILGQTICFLKCSNQKKERIQSLCNQSLSSLFLSMRFSYIFMLHIRLDCLTAISMSLRTSHRVLSQLPIQVLLLLLQGLRSKLQYLRLYAV